MDEKRTILTFKYFHPKASNTRLFFSKKVPFFNFLPDRLALTKKVTILHVVQLGSDTCKCESHRNVRVLNLFPCPFLFMLYNLQGGKDPIVVVKREEGSENKATRRKSQ